jgi:hypothetical protein
LASNNVQAIAIDNEGGKWFGTRFDGVSHFDGTTWTTYNTSNSGLAHNYVLAIAIDIDGSKWFGADGGGVSHFDGTTWTTYNTSNSGLVSNFIKTMAIDSNGSKWLGFGIGKGLSRFGPPLTTETYIRVVDEQGAPLPGAWIYRNGQLITDTSGTPLATNGIGILLVNGLDPNDRLVALAPRHKQSTVRDAHGLPGQAWAFRTNVTNAHLDDQGNITVVQSHDPTSGEYLLTTAKDNVLVTFNLVISIEWDATDDYMDEIKRAVQYASDYLYDLTDGQMTFGQVTIYDEGINWADADIQISTKNIVRPHAYIGGIISADKSHVIRLGRGWDGNSGNEGPWDQPDGYRTLAHEFSHYAFHLYDEYFAYIFDQNGNLVGEAPTFCTGPENRNPANDATNASAMDWQYSSSELSARSVLGLWSPLCEETAQWQINGESTWETLAKKYADTNSSPRWQLKTPAGRGAIMAGPAGLTNYVSPTVTIHNSGAAGPPRPLTVYDHEAKPYRGAIVALYKLDGRVIGQGFTDPQGQLEIYGAEEGDRLRAAAFDGGLAGSVIVSTADSLTLTLAPVTGLMVQATNGIPHLQVRAELSPIPNRVDLFISLQNFGSGADPSVFITQPGSEVGFTPNLSYSPTTGAWEGQISFSAVERGMGRVRAVGAVGGSLVRLQSTYRLQQVFNNQRVDVYSDDGNLSLHLEPDSLPGAFAYLAVMPPGAVPGPLPAGLVLVGDAYDVTASGALASLEKPAILTLHYDGALVNSSSTPAGLNIYHWNPISQLWQAVSGKLDEDHKVMIAPITVLGTYALLAPPGPGTGPGSNKILLPIILKDEP